MQTADDLIHHADWLEFASALEPRSIDLLYVDPPFNTGGTRAASAGEFRDAWPSTADWVEWFAERFRATLPALKPTACMLVHVDWRTVHHVRLLLDETLGEDCFVNHLVWAYGLGGSSPRRFARKHDDILFYARTADRHYFHPPMVPATSNRMKGQLKKATDVIHIPAINNMAAERLGWPTQKPLALLELLIGACCPPDGTVLDPCCGSGTTLAAAATLERRSIGCDINEDAARLARQRLSAILFPAATNTPPTAPPPGGDDR